jgi:hypothetical protein
MDKTKVCILAFLLAMATGPAVFGEVLPPQLQSIESQIRFVERRLRDPSLTHNERYDLKRSLSELRKKKAMKEARRKRSDSDTNPRELRNQRERQAMLEGPAGSNPEPPGLPGSSGPQQPPIIAPDAFPPVTTALSGPQPSALPSSLPPVTGVLPSVTASLPSVTASLPSVTASLPSVSLPSVTAALPSVTAPLPQLSVPLPQVPVTVPQVTAPVSLPSVPLPQVTVPVALPPVTVPIPQPSVPLPQVPVTVPQVTAPVSQPAVPLPQAPAVIPQTSSVPKLGI